MTGDYCGRSREKDVSLGELRAEIKRRKTLAESELDAYFRVVWPARKWTSWLTTFNIFPAFFGAMYFEVVVMAHYEAFVREHVWGMPALFLITGIVFFLIYSPRIFWSRKEHRLIGVFKNKYPAHAEALWGS